MEYSKYSKVNPQWTEFVSRHPQLHDLDKVGIVERRRIFSDVEASLPPRTIPEDVARGAVEVRTFAITARDGYHIPVRSYVPLSSESGSGSGSKRSQRPVLVYLHAGGFLFGDLESGDINCRTLAARLDISVLNVGYRLAPEWPFPCGVDDAFDAVAWTAANAEKSLNASPSAGGFLVGGISSGANFAGVVAYAARDAGLSPPITGLFVSIPVCILPQAYGLLSPELRDSLRSLEQNAENPLLTGKSLGDIQELYGSPPSDKRISFLLNKDHTNLPGRAYFQICGGDPLRDEAFLWQKLLREHSGTRSKVHLYSGMPHGFWRFLDMPASREWLDDLVDGVGFLCRGEDTEDGDGDGDGGGDELVVKGV